MTKESIISKWFWCRLSLSRTPVIEHELYVCKENGKGWDWEMAQSVTGLLGKHVDPELGFPDLTKSQCWEEHGHGDRLVCLVRRTHSRWRTINKDTQCYPPQMHTCPHTSMQILS